MGLGGPSLDDRAPLRSELELACDLLADFECADANVRADRGDELGGRLLHRHDSPAYDTRHGAAPSCMHRGNVSARRMGEEHGNTVGGARSHGNPSVARNERIAFPVLDLFGVVRARYLSNLVSMDLPLLEELLD